MALDLRRPRSRQRGYIAFGIRRGLLKRGSEGGLSFSATLQSSLAPITSAPGNGTHTFTRATTAYDYDWENLSKPVLSGEARFTGARRVANLVSTTSEDFNNAAWTKTTITIGTGVTDPLGGTSAYSATATAASSLLQSQGTAVVGNTYTNSLWIQRRTGSGTVNFRNINGANSDITAALADGLWHRFSTVVAATGTGLRCTVVIVTDTDAINVWRGQVEDVTGQSNQNPSEYVSVGVLAAPYHGAGVDGVKYFSTLNGNTVAANVVTEATGAAITVANGASALTCDAYGPFGYFSEGARTNLFTYSNDFTNVAWVKTTMTTAKTSTGPDGAASSATRLTATGALAAVGQLIVAAASDRTLSVWARRVTGTGTIKLFQGLTTTADLSSSLNTSTYSLIQLDATVDITLLGAGIEIGTDTDAIDVWCGQFEAGAFASSPIPTTTVAVTRNADVLTYPYAGNLNASSGTVYSEVYLASQVGVTTTPASVMFVGTSSTADGLALAISAVAAYTTQLFRDGTNVVIATGLANITTAVRKCANAYGGTTVSLTRDGAVVQSGAFDGDTGNLLIGIGCEGVSGTLQNYGTNRNVRFYSAKLSGAALQAMTTP